MKTGKTLVYHNNPRVEKNFLDDVDNLASISNLKNLVLGPITHNGQITGVLQMSNKKGLILPFDLKIFECVLETLGSIFKTNKESSFGVK